MLVEIMLLLLGLAASALVGVRLQGRSTRKSVAIIVLGDIGRSPRMLYHAQSFAARGYQTTIVAYRGESLCREAIRALLLNLRGGRVYPAALLDCLSSSHVCVPPQSAGVDQQPLQAHLPAPSSAQSLELYAGPLVGAHLHYWALSQLSVCSGESPELLEMAALYSLSSRDLNSRTPRPFQLYPLFSWQLVFAGAGLSLIGTIRDTLCWRSGWAQLIQSSNWQNGGLVFACCDVLGIT